MKKTSFVVALLVSAALAGCHKKSANTTPTNTSAGSAAAPTEGGSAAPTEGGSAAPTEGGAGSAM